MFSVGIVTYNNQDTIEECLESCLAQDGLDEIIVVDNKSLDNTQNLIKGTTYKNTLLKFIPRKNNIGFGAAHNLAYRSRKSNSKYHIILNPDIRLNSNADLKRLCDFIENSEGVVATVPKFLNLDGSLQPQNKRFPSLWDLFLRRSPSWLQNKFKERMDKYVMKDYGYVESYPLFALCGALVCVESKVFENIDGFDERFFLYFEDVDLGRRLQRHGVCKFAPEVQVYHHWNRSAHKSLKPFLYFLQSGFKYFNKWGWSIF